MRRNEAREIDALRAAGGQEPRAVDTFDEAFTAQPVPVVSEAEIRAAEHDVADVIELSSWVAYANRVLE